MYPVYPVGPAAPVYPVYPVGPPIPSFVQVTGLAIFVSEDNSADDHPVPHPDGSSNEVCTLVITTAGDAHDVLVVPSKIQQVPDTVSFANRTSEKGAAPEITTVAESQPPV